MLDEYRVNRIGLLNFLEPFPLKVILFIRDFARGSDPEKGRKIARSVIGFERDCSLLGEMIGFGGFHYYYVPHNEGNNGPMEHVRS